MKVLRILERIEKWIVVIMFAIMVAACFIQVVNRNIFKIPVSGFEEAAKYSMVYMVLLGTEMGLRDGTQIAIRGAVERLRGKKRKIIEIISRVIIIVFSCFMLRAGIAMVVRQGRIGQTSPGLGLPMSVPYFALVLSFGLITIVQLGLLIAQIVRFNKSEDAKGGE